MKTIGTDVLIVGAGAAGLTLAIELARRNVDFRLIDKAPQPFPGSRGKGHPAADPGSVRRHGVSWTASRRPAAGIRFSACTAATGSWTSR
ncbi:MAG: FAD-dependent oxidoreductase [Rhizomicrobium sp.]